MVETLKGFPSVVANITIAAGSNNDPEGKEGVAHFLEHMTFKGTKTKTASQISTAFESVGSVINASTSNSFIKFYVKCIAEDTEFCFELLSDIYLNATLPDAEIEKERLVILQELAMVNDDPERCVNELHAKTVYGDSPLGKPIGGFAETVSAISKQDLFAFQTKHFVPSKTVVSFAGNISFAKAEQLVEQYFKMQQTTLQPFVASKKPTHFAKNIPFAAQAKPIMQNHVVLSFPGVSAFQKDAKAYLLISFFLGGGMSSRLFQRIREDHSLVYTIVAYNSSGLHSGDLEIYFATEPKNLEKALQEIKKEINEIVIAGVPQTEFDKTKKFLKNILLMMRENIEYIATNNAKDVLCYNKPRSLKYELKKMESITLEHMHHLAKHMFKWPNASLCVVGPLPSKQLQKSWLKSN